MDDGGVACTVFFTIKAEVKLDVRFTFTNYDFRSLFVSIYLDIWKVFPNQPNSQQSESEIIL